METDCDSKKLEIILKKNYVLKVTFCSHMTKTITYDTITSFNAGFFAYDTITDFNSKSIIFDYFYSHSISIREDRSTIRCITFRNSTYINDYGFFKISLLHFNENDAELVINMINVQKGSHWKYSEFTAIKITDLNNLIKNGSVIEFENGSFAYFEKIKELITSFNLEELLPCTYICKPHTLTKRAVVK